eukprot:NODE_4330_length_685_cov_39.923810.p3 GENE.NODE_4330_length_685_cov_39.923810~~NODE_4330_length_685_cov_39.923810.p3  ORF type:complete len:143 (+),score=37.16 NODE_4330_length_685_cov_39.923810:3-431(+)
MGNTDLPRSFLDSDRRPLARVKAHPSSEALSMLSFSMLSLAPFAGDEEAAPRASRRAAPAPPLRRCPSSGSRCDSLQALTEGDDHTSKWNAGRTSSARSSAATDECSEPGECDDVEVPLGELNACDEVALPLGEVHGRDHDA